MNFARDVVEAAPARRLALVELARDGSRREWTFGEVAAGASELGGRLAGLGVGRGDVVMTLIGNRPEWVLAMVACFRCGAVVLPCNEQLRAKDLRLRIDVAQPAAIVADERNRDELVAAQPSCPVLWTGGFVPGAAGAGEGGDPAAAAELSAEDPCLITFTSGTAGEPKAVLHAQR